MKTQAHEYNALYENKTARLMAKVQAVDAQLKSLRELKYQLLQLFHTPSSGVMGFAEI